MPALGRLMLVHLCWLAAIGPAAAQTVEQFYQGRQLKLIIGTGAGQDYDIWGRLIVRYIGRYVPGQPSFIVENMPGGGNIIATNHLYNIAPRDGTVIGMVSRSMTDAAAMGLPNVRFEPTKFQWIGSPERSGRVVFAGPNSGISRAEELFEKELIVGATGAGQAGSTVPTALRNVLGMKFRVVHGYKQPSDIHLALGRGEIGGVVRTVGAPTGERRELIEVEKLVPLFSLESEPIPGFDIPTVFKFTKTQEQRAILEFMAGALELGRPLMFPPEVPKDRVMAFRAAFNRMVKDQAFVQEAEKLGFEVQPKTGEEIEQLVARSMRTPKDILEKAGAAVAEK